MARQSTDPCTLCGQAPATKTRSHIFPKFMARRILSKQPVKVHKLTMQDGVAKKDLGQDISFEDHLFCPTCEDYFNVLETAFGASINFPIVQNDNKGYYEVIEVAKDTGRGYLEAFDAAKICLKADPIMTQLLIDSIIYRVHVCGLPMLSHWNFPDAFINPIKDNLLRFRSGKALEVRAKCLEPNAQISLTKYILMSPEKKIDIQGDIVTEYIDMFGVFLRILAGEYYIWIAVDTPGHESFMLNDAKRPVSLVPMPLSYYQSEYEAKKREVVERLQRVDLK